MKIASVGVNAEMLSVEGSPSKQDPIPSTAGADIGGRLIHFRLGNFDVPIRR